VHVDARGSAYSDVLAGLSYALDLTEGQHPGHCVRSCLIGLRLADAAGIDPGGRSSLFHALLMKDLGCSSNAARFSALFGAADQELKAAIKVVDWPRMLQSFRFVVRHTAPGHFWLKRVWHTLGVLAHGTAGARDVVQTRCDRGADIARLLGFSEATVAAIRALDEHWNGRGQPLGLAGEEIPRLARVLNLAQTCEVFLTTYGQDAMFQMAAMRRGRWFDPALVDALIGLRDHQRFWRRLRTADALTELRRTDVPDALTTIGEADLDRTAEAFAHVIDAKSPWTYRHSTGVAEIAVRVAGVLGLPDGTCRLLRRAALLHDLGKLGVSNLILDKPGRLDARELAVVKAHPLHTARILDRVPALAPLSDLAAAHHERLDGRGYHRRLDGTALSLPQRILAIADVGDALRMSRPYRDGLPADKVIAIMRRDAGAGLDSDCVEAFASIAGTLPAAADLPAVAVVDGLKDDYIQAA
jgi:putative nucleotidyltransferase with HDIG domain